jgi:hypothetical protein
MIDDGGVLSGPLVTEPSQQIATQRLGHQTGGPKSHKEKKSTAPPATEGAAHNLNNRSRLGTLIQIKHAKPACSNSKARPAARKSQKRKEAREGSREPSKLEGLPKSSSGIFGPTPTRVNLCRLLISKYLASVAPKPQTAKPPANVETGGFAFSPNECRFGTSISGGRPTFGRQWGRLCGPGQTLGETTTI